MLGQDVSPPPIPQAGQTDMSNGLSEPEERIEDALEAASLGVDIQMEWEEVDGSLGVDGSLEDDGWSDVEQDFGGDEMLTRGLILTDAEWASDVASEDEFEI